MMTECIAVQNEQFYTCEQQNADKVDFQDFLESCEPTPQSQAATTSSKLRWPPKIDRAVPMVKSTSPAPARFVS
jgi:hypothetical protein